MDRRTLENLRSLIQKVSYREGDFTLSSGKKSSFYIDLKPTTLHAQGAAWVGALGVDRILEFLKINGIAPDLLAGVGGLTLGADPIATAISIEAGRRGLPWHAFIVRKEPKKHGTERYIEGIENLDGTSKKVVIIEDVVTTGASSLKAWERAKLEGLDPVVVLTLVDREDAESASHFSRGESASSKIPLVSIFNVKDLKL